MFNSVNIDSVFSAQPAFPKKDKTEVYVIHSNNTNYILYDFRSIETPKIVRSGPTVVSRNNLWFMDNKNGRNEKKRLKNLLETKVGLNYDDRLILISNKNFCTVNLNGTSEKEVLITSYDFSLA